ncbi:MAG: prolyl oligopeptidase family serine peptidase, partial [Myxococcota bacterium]
PKWHKAAVRENRPKSYQDFAAVARDLAARGLTQPGRLACHGASNGGLLTGVMLTRYPELFGAIWSSVGVYDMLRFHKFPAGRAWIDEYGDPDDPAPPGGPARPDARPRVGLLCNGTEAGKGTALTRAADALLAAMAAREGAPFVYQGYVEGSQLFADTIDVVVCDGFTGNVALKLAEGLAGAIQHMLRDALAADLRGTVGGRLIRPHLRQLRHALDYAHTGGALLGGVAGVVTIAHGRSDALAIDNAIRASARFVRLDLPGRMGRALAAVADAASDDRAHAGPMDEP